MGSKTTIQTATFELFTQQYEFYQRELFPANLLQSDSIEQLTQKRQQQRQDDDDGELLDFEIEYQPPSPMIATLLEILTSHKLFTTSNFPL
ncbi:unnamed protein product [Absidia cylindrospora]